MNSIIVANWKMNPLSVKNTEHLFDVVRKSVRGIKKTEVILCPPFIYLDFIAKRSSKILRAGAQDSFWEPKGAFTGEISPVMIKDIGCDYVILGHSERKKYLKEDCAIINKKVKTALRARLKVVLCVGEESRESFNSEGKWIGEVDLVLKDQLTQCLDGIDNVQISNIIIAYEPIWAISTSDHAQEATPNDALSASLLIRKVISRKYDKKIAMSLRVLYGGSVDSKNVSGFLQEDGIDGVLVGGASLNGSEFVRMVKIAEDLN